MGPHGQCRRAPVGQATRLLSGGLWVRTPVCLGLVAQPPIPNVANVCVARPSPGGTIMTTDSPSESLPRPSTLAGQRLLPPPKDPYLLEGFNPRGELLAAHGPTSAHPTHPGGGETYAPPDWAPMRRELLRSAPHPQSFHPREEPLAKFGPTAAHPTHPGGGIIYSPTGRAPKRWWGSRMQTRLHDSPARGKPLAKFGTAVAHPTHPGGGKIYPPTGRAPKRRESLRMPPHPHYSLPGGEPQAKFGLQPRTPSLIWGDTW